MRIIHYAIQQSKTSYIMTFGNFGKIADADVVQVDSFPKIFENTFNECSLPVRRLILRQNFLRAVIWQHSFYWNTNLEALVEYFL